MRGAVITHVFTAGNDVSVQTNGPSGTTFSTFVIEDAVVRGLVLERLIIGCPVHVFTASEI